MILDMGREIRSETLFFFFFSLVRSLNNYLFLLQGSGGYRQFWPRLLRRSFKVIEPFFQGSGRTAKNSEDIESSRRKEATAAPPLVLVRHMNGRSRQLGACGRAGRSAPIVSRCHGPCSLCDESMVWTRARGRFELSAGLTTTDRIASSSLSCARTACLAGSGKARQSLTILSRQLLWFVGVLLRLGSWASRILPYQKLVETVGATTGKGEQQSEPQRGQVRCVVFGDCSSLV